MYEPIDFNSDQSMRFDTFQPQDFVPRKFNYRAEKEETLIELLKSGSSVQKHDAFGEIYRRFSKDTLRFIRSKEEDEEEAKDLWASVWIIALMKLSEFEYRGTSVKSWLFSIAVNKLQEHWRHKKERSQVPFDDAYTQTLHYVERELKIGEDESSEQTNNEVNTQIDVVMTKLKREFKREEQTIIDLFYFKGYGCSQIGKFLNKKEGTIRAKKRRILLRLRRYLEELSKESKHE